jgi:anti-sigma factor RsiW
VKRGMVEEVEPEIRAMATDPEVSEAYAEWAESRRLFNEGLKIPGSEARAAKWQKDYFRGKARFGATPPDHHTKLRPKVFADKP